MRYSEINEVIRPLAEAAEPNLSRRERPLPVWPPAGNTGKVRFHSGPRAPDGTTGWKVLGEVAVGSGGGGRPGSFRGDDGGNQAKASPWKIPFISVSVGSLRK